MSLRVSASRYLSSTTTMLTGQATNNTTLKPAMANAAILAWTSHRRNNGGGGNNRSLHQNARHHHPIWSDTLSFASPEADFTLSWQNVPNGSNTIRFLHQGARHHPIWSDTLSFASPEADFTLALENVPKQPKELPRTWAGALQEQDEAVVITTAEAPHRVVHVNQAWENLCGYSKQEALYRPIGPLLQQDQAYKSHTHQAARHLLDQLEASQYCDAQEAYLENYTKEGRPFVNHLRVGPLYLEDENDHGTPAFLIAFLEEVQRKDVPLRLVV